jgi:hypothetical protein
MSDTIPAERRAPEGTVWECAACGRMAEDRYGLVGQHHRGWDESCRSNAFPSRNKPNWNAERDFLRAIAPSSPRITVSRTKEGLVLRIDDTRGGHVVLWSFAKTFAKRAGSSGCGRTSLRTSTARPSTGSAARPTRR